MKIKYLGLLLAASALALGGCAETGGAGGDPVELVLGTDSNKSDLFKMGNVGIVADLQGIGDISK